MKVLVLGGDGFCGWPTALHLSERGHDVRDRRQLRPAQHRQRARGVVADADHADGRRGWRPGRSSPARRSASTASTSPTHYHRLLTLLQDWQPDAVVHFAEQRAAPYSMKSSWHKRYTVNNNLNATNNLLAAIVEAELDIHVVHLGTMGVYGYGTAGVKIPEGYLQVEIPIGDGETVSSEILYPPNPGTIYHMTKTQDQLLFAYYNKNDERAGHRPAPGHRLGHADRRDPSGRAADQPLRLRRRLRHGAQPLPDAGGDRLPADRARHRRPDPRVHPHPGHGALHRARDRATRRQTGERVRHPQPDDRDASPDRPRQDGLAAHRRRDRPRREPAQRGRGERPAASRTASCSSSGSRRSRSRRACWRRSPRSRSASSTGSTSTRSRRARSGANTTDAP